MYLLNVESSSRHRRIQWTFAVAKRLRQHKFFLAAHKFFIAAHRPRCIRTLATRPVRTGSRRQCRVLCHRDLARRLRARQAPLQRSGRCAGPLRGRARVRGPPALVTRAHVRAQRARARARHAARATARDLPAQTSEAVQATRPGNAQPEAAAHRSPSSLRSASLASPLPCLYGTRWPPPTRCSA